jgi:hypothetical protein
VLDFTPPPPVSSQVDRFAELSITVEAAQGNLIAERLQTANGDGELAAGIAATFGSPVTAPQWFFPLAQVTDDVEQTFTLYNPGDTEAQVDLEVRADADDDPSAAPVVGGAPAPQPPVGSDLPAGSDAPGTAPPVSLPPQDVEPFELTVPPRSSTSLVLAPDQGPTGTSEDNNRLAAGRVPVGPRFSVTVRVREGPGVVAQQTWRARAPAPPPGFFMALGSPVAAGRWLIADGRTGADPRQEFLVVANPGAEAATMRVNGLQAGQLIPALSRNPTVPPGGRVVLDLSSLSPDVQVVEVDADHPVVVVRSLVPAIGVQGVVVSPVADTLVALDVPDPLKTPVPTLPESSGSPDASESSAGLSSGSPGGPGSSPAPTTPTTLPGATSVPGVPTTLASPAPGGATALN